MSSIEVPRVREFISGTEWETALPGLCAWFREVIVWVSMARLLDEFGSVWIPLAPLA
jgi:hypothetical protein